MAAWRNLPEEILESVRLGEVVDAVDDNGNTALTYACNCGALDAAVVRLGAGTDPNHRDDMEIAQ